jgi:hypothetical protein
MLIRDVKCPQDHAKSHPLYTKRLNIHGINSQDMVTGMQDMLTGTQGIVMLPRHTNTISGHSKRLS